MYALVCQGVKAII